MKRTDEQIKIDIENRLSRDTRIDATDVLIEVNEGVVTLTGTVPSYNTKLAAYEKARETRGIISANNQLSVVYPSNVAKSSDAEIESNAKNVLLWNPDIDESKIEVSFDSGTVTLKGTVSWYWHWHKAEELVLNLSGVLVMKNELAVVPTERVTDELIAKCITDELDQLYNLEASNVLVEVADGVVTLTGTCKNYMNEKQANDVASQTQGVVQVINNINIVMV